MPYVLRWPLRVLQICSSGAVRLCPCLRSFFACTCRRCTLLQRYLYARTVRHLRTAESTHARTLGYMLLICGTIVAASFVQVGGAVVGMWW